VCGRQQLQKNIEGFAHGFAMHMSTKNVENSLKSLKILSHTVRTPHARTHQLAAAGVHASEITRVLNLVGPYPSTVLLSKDVNKY
jgi:hypothetical protein